MGEEENSDDYIRTASGNFVSRQATLQGAQHVELKGRTWVDAGVTLRGDLAAIRVGRYNSIGKNTVVAPPVLMPSATEPSYSPVSVGAHTTIGSDCDIQAAAIGSYNSIGNNVVLGPRVILKDAVVVVKGTKIPPDTVVPPFTLVKMSDDDDDAAPQLVHIPLSPATIPILQDAALDTYHDRVRLIS